MEPAEPLGHAGTEPAPRRRKPGRWFGPRNLGVALIVLTVIGEIVLRLVFGLGNPLLYRTDAACQYLPAPNQHIRRFFAENDINADSMRCAPVVWPKPSGEWRVLFVGDSVTYGGTQIDQPDIFTSRLAAALPGKLHRPVEVLNASAGGWAVGNELGYIQGRGIFSADAVIFVLNTYDMTQELAAAPINAPSYPMQRPLTAIGETWSRYIAPRLFHVSTADAGSTAPSSLDDPAALSRTTHWLDTAREIATQGGAEFAVVYSPVVGADGKVPESTRAAQAYLEHWADAAHVSLLNLEPAYQAGGSGGAVYRDGIHLTAYGNKVAAEALWRWNFIQKHAR